MNIDWNLCFICQQQGKDKLRSTLQGILNQSQQIYLDFGSLEYLMLHVQMSYLPYKMMLSLKVI